MPYFNSAHEAQTQRFMQGFGALGRGLGNILKPESTEEKILKAEEERRKAEEERRKTADAKRAETDALTKELAGLMENEPAVPGMTPPPAPVPPGIPMSEMVKSAEYPVPKIGMMPVPGMGVAPALNLPKVIGHTEMPPSLEVPAPKGIMQTAPVPVPGMGPDPRIDNWKRQRALMTRLGQFGEARTLGAEIEGLQVNDPPGLVRAELSIIRPDMTKDELRALLRETKSMVARNRIMSLIEKRVGEEREETKGKTEFERRKELEELQQTGATERTRMGEEGADRRTERTVEGRVDAAGAKPPTPGRPSITLDGFIENRRKKLERTRSVAAARYNRVKDDKFPGKPAFGVDQATFDKYRTELEKAEDAENALDEDAVAEEWQNRYGGGAPATKVPVPAAEPKPVTPKPDAAIPIPDSVADKMAALVAKHGGDRAKVEADPEYQTLKTAISNKAEVVLPDPETPENERGYVDPAEQEATASATLLKRSRIDKTLREAGLTDDERRRRYAEVLAGGGRYGHLSPEEREALVGRMAAEDDAKVAAIRKPKAEGVDPLATELAFRETLAGEHRKVAAKDSKEAVEARKKRLGSAAHFLTR